MMKIGSFLLSICQHSSKNPWLATGMLISMIDTIDKVVLLVDELLSGVPLANNAQDHGYSFAKINSFSKRFQRFLPTLLLVQLGLSC